MPADPTTQKLQAVIAQAGLLSRRAAEAAIVAGRITVNGELAHLGQRVQGSEAITLDGKPIKSEDEPLQSTKVYYLINKPAGVVSSTHDELGRATVVTLIPQKKNRIYPVGRLDVDSRGLMLLTNDGDLAYQLTHPKYEVPKEYHVQLDRSPTPSALQFLSNGVKLGDSWTKADDIYVLSDDHKGCWISITVHEGKYHHVKRMLQRAGYDTVALTRVRLGPFDLQEVPSKGWIELNGDDVRERLTAFWAEQGA